MTDEVVQVPTWVCEGTSKEKHAEKRVPRGEACPCCGRRLLED